MFASTIRSALRARVATPRISNVVRTNVGMTRISIPHMRNYSSHHEETFEEFTARYVYDRDTSARGVQRTLILRQFDDTLSS